MPIDDKKIVRKEKKRKEKLTRSMASKLSFTTLSKVDVGKV